MAQQPRAIMRTFYVTETEALSAGSDVADAARAFCFSDIEGTHYGAWLLGHANLDTTALYTRVRQYHDPGRNQPTRPACTTDRREAATRGLAGPPCAARSWRSQTSFIAMRPTGAGPMPEI